jgi:hypothetical protein
MATAHCAGNCVAHMRLLAYKEKGPTIFMIGPVEIMPAATYSPTQFPAQYHRRYQA